MTHTYFLKRIADLDDAVRAVLKESSKANPFLTPEFADAMQALGRETWMIGAGPEEAPTEVALGFIRRGRLSVELEFVSLPAAAQNMDFWDAVSLLCARAGVTDITAGTFGSPEFLLPHVPGEVSRRMRQEFVLPLKETDLASLLSSNHKRNVKKAQKADISIRRTREHGDCLRHHVELMSRSAERRVARGESVSINANIAEYRAFLTRRAGELFQAVRGTEILSSILVLTSPLVGYYQSAGTSPEGMSAGASHLLVHTVAQQHQADGRSHFNLGGAPEGSSLARFKLGFGATPVALSAAVSYVGPGWKRNLRHAIRMASESQHLMHLWLSRLPKRVSK